MATGQVLVCAPTGRDAALLVQSLSTGEQAGQAFATIDELAAALDHTALAIILAEEALRPRGVEALFTFLKAQPAWSDVALILLTQKGTENSRVSRGLVDLLGARGNVTILERPLQVPTLVSAVRSAVRARTRQYEVRDLLQQRDENEQVLQAERTELERRVLYRTLELTKANGDLRREVTERLNAEHALRQLSQNVVRLQDEERRRIARELHDSAGQYLSAVTLTLGQLARRMATAEVRDKELVQEALSLVGDCIREVRTMSYLLHPPVLDDFGLASAVRWYVEGFAQRSGIQVKLDLAEEFPRFGRELETAVFRIVQEGLTNVHRHSGAKKTNVGLRVKDHLICATITDDGRGMAPDVLDGVKEGRGGVGLLGMRERVKKLGGSIWIESGGDGTKIRAELPVGELAEATGN
jgi:signal transduction histidine kinase